MNRSLIYISILWDEELEGVVGIWQPIRGTHAFNLEPRFLVMPTLEELDMLELHEVELEFACRVLASRR